LSERYSFIRAYFCGAEVLPIDVLFFDHIGVAEGD
jgi:hypothetical protein